jgi:hypothetical protein
MEAWARYRGVEILAFHTDLDVSGAMLERPGLERALWSRSTWTSSTSAPLKAAHLSISSRWETGLMKDGPLRPSTLLTRTYPSTLTLAVLALGADTNPLRAWPEALRSAGATGDRDRLRGAQGRPRQSDHVQGGPGSVCPRHRGEVAFMSRVVPMPDNADYVASACFAMRNDNGATVRPGLHHHWLMLGCSPTERISSPGQRIGL